MEQRISKIETNVAVLQSNLEGIKESMKANDVKTDEIHKTIIEVSNTMNGLNSRMENNTKNFWRGFWFVVGLGGSILTAYFIGLFKT